MRAHASTRAQQLLLFLVQIHAAECGEGASEAERQTTRSSKALGRAVHRVSCGVAHAEDVRTQAGRSFFFFVDAAGGEFPCPMCRSVANCLIPCGPDEEFLDSGDASWQPEVTHSTSAPSRVRPPLPALQSALPISACVCATGEQGRSGG
ncbi:HEX1 [Symbiodinium sp. CCMP2592]|nr:HEX1 [Symbiodinium sp. CCMP2592]